MPPGGSTVSAGQRSEVSQSLISSFASVRLARHTMVAPRPSWLNEARGAPVVYSSSPNPSFGSLR
jgi:hypothetical protein